MKRALAIFLVLLSLAAMLTSCKDNPDPTSTVETAETGITTTTKRVYKDGVDEKDEGWLFWAQF